VPPAGQYPSEHIQGAMGAAHIGAITLVYAARGASVSPAGARRAFEQTRNMPVDSRSKT
jgi:hypothetical protein